MLRRRVLIGLAVSLFASGAHGQVSFVGKKVSVASTDGTTIVTIPASPATTVLSVGIPEKYKSSKNVLAISTSVLEYCASDNVYSELKVGGSAAEPDAANGPWHDCSNNSAFETFAREFFLVPESAGGPVVPPGATIDLILSSTFGTAQATLATIHAELAK